MKLLLIFFLLQCAVIQKGNPLPRFSETAKERNPIQKKIFVIINQEFYRNGYKGKSDSDSNILLAQLKDSGQFLSIEADIEKAELILEIEIQTRKTNNSYLPFFTILTFTLVPYFQTIELRETFRIIEKNGDIVFQANRIQNSNYWFGLFFLVKGMIQFSAEENHNRSDFESDLLKKINQNIMDEMKTLKLN